MQRSLDGDAKDASWDPSATNGSTPTKRNRDLAKSRVGVENGNSGGGVRDGRISRTTSELVESQPSAMCQVEGTVSLAYASFYRSTCDGCGPVGQTKAASVPRGLGSNSFTQSTKCSQIKSLGKLGGSVKLARWPGTFTMQ